MQKLGITDNAGAMRVLAASQALAQGKKRWGNKTGYGEDLIAMEDTDLRLRTSTRAMPVNWCHNLGKSELFSQIRLLQLYKWFSSGSSKLFRTSFARRAAAGYEDCRICFRWFRLRFERRATIGGRK